MHFWCSLIYDVQLECILMDYCLHNLGAECAYDMSQVQAQLVESCCGSCKLGARLPNRMGSLGAAS